MAANMTYGVDTYYVERSNGRWSYWTYCDGHKYFVSEASVKKAVKQGDKLVHVA